MAKKKKNPPVLLDLRKELLLQVDGEEEKNHTIKWDVLKQIGDSTQNLILKLAKYSLEDNVLPPEALKLEFVGLHEGSAIPDFKLTEEPNLLFPADKLYKRLNTDFSFVLGAISDGNFQKIANTYKEPAVKNEIIEAVYNFTNSAGTRPFSVVKKDGEKYRPIARVRIMSPKIKGALRVEDKKQVAEIQVAESEAVGKFIIKTKGNRITKKQL
jgi:hypothetical protein